MISFELYGVLLSIQIGDVQLVVVIVVVAVVAVVVVVVVMERHKGVLDWNQIQMAVHKVDSSSGDIIHLLRYWGSC